MDRSDWKIEGKETIEVVHPRYLACRGHAHGARCVDLARTYFQICRAGIEMLLPYDVAATKEFEPVSETCLTAFCFFTASRWMQSA